MKNFNRIEFMNIHGDINVKLSLLKHIIENWHSLSWKENTDFQWDCDCENQVTAKWTVDDLWEGDNYEIPRYDWVNKVGLDEELRLYICNCGDEETLFVSTDLW